jgi:hypothetical protein
MAGSRAEVYFIGASGYARVVTWVCVPAVKGCQCLLSGCLSRCLSRAHGWDGNAPVTNLKGMVTRSSSSDMFAVFLGGFRFGEVLLVDWLGRAVLSLRCCGMRLKVGKSKEEAGSGTCVSQASTPWRAATCDYRQESIPLIDKNIHSILLSHTHSPTQNAVHPCLQHAQAARRARLPRPAAREGPASAVLAQDEVSRSCS